MIDNMLTKQA